MKINIKSIKDRIIHNRTNFLFRLFINIYSNVKTIIGSYPIFFYRLYGNSWQKGHPVYNDTELIIESFPSSGNTFFVFSFYSVNKLKIGHHMHMIAQIKRAKKHNVPILILIRHPEDAITSWLARRPNYYPVTLIRYYIRFYKFVLTLSDTKIVIAKFETFVNDINIVIEYMNKIFDTQYNLISNSIEVRNEYFKNAPTKGTKPSKKRDASKITVRNNVKSTSGLIEAIKLYNTIIDSNKLNVV